MPFANSLSSAQINFAIFGQRRADGEIAAFVQQLDVLDVAELHLVEELAHLGDSRRALLEAVEVVLGEDEVALFPPAKEFIALRPQKALFNRGRDDLVLIVLDIYRSLRIKTKTSF